MNPSAGALAVLLALLPSALVLPGTALWLPLLGAIIAVFAVDGWRLWRQPPPRVERRGQALLALLRPSLMTLRLHNGRGRSWSGLLYDELPDGAAADRLPQRVRLPADSTAEVSYRLTAQRRGDLRLGDPSFVGESPWRLWRRRLRLPAAQTLRVYPDFGAITGYLQALGAQQTRQLGVRLVQRRGEGLEFEQLREYRDGDGVRQIDWKATARRQTLISREYVDERNQQLLFVMDSGRRMRARDGALSHFDHALNAMLLLAWVALRQGDSVALLSFGAERRWIPPQRGAGGVKLLLNAVYDLHSGTAAADYVDVAEEVMRRQRKRALVVLMTNLRDSDDDLEPALALLRRRHLVLLANQREVVLDELQREPVQDFDGALRQAEVHGYLEARRRQQRRLAPLVDRLLEETPQRLPVAVVNAYWDLKRSGRL